MDIITAIVLSLMTGSWRNFDTGPLGEDMVFSLDLHRQLTRQHVEKLTCCGMDVSSFCGACGHPLLDDHHVAGWREYPSIARVAPLVMFCILDSTFQSLHLIFCLSREHWALPFFDRPDDRDHVVATEPKLFCFAVERQTHLHQRRVATVFMDGVDDKPGVLQHI